MNRPRNRQGRQERGGRGQNTRYGPRKSEGVSVPNIAQVVTGAGVSIVLKQDQSTGHEVQGIVQDILTSGNHPRGIKVRLTDGRIGRVQRMFDLPSAVQPSPSNVHQALNSHRRSNTVSKDDGYRSDLPPARTLADYLPTDFEMPDTTLSEPRPSNSTKCPVCHEFEGDEIAVSRHVEQHFD